MLVMPSVCFMALCDPDSSNLIGIAVVPSVMVERHVNPTLYKQSLTHWVVNTKHLGLQVDQMASMPL